MLKKRGFVAMVLVLVMGLTLVGFTQTTRAGEIVLKAVLAWPKQIHDNDGFFALQEKVNEMGKGKVRIQLLGGPEVIPNTELINAVKAGTIDIAWLSAGYTVSNVPAANAIKLSRFTPWEARENGVYDLWNEIYEKQANAHLLGKGMPGVKFHLYTVKKINSLKDFKGLSIRVTPSYKDFVLSLKASPVTMAPGEVYTALERGIIDGYGWIEFGIADWGWEEHTKYVIDPGFYQVDTLGLINLDKWNSLPDDVKEILTKAAKEVEREMVGHYEELFKQDREKLKEYGIEVIELSEEEAKIYVDMAYEAVMNEVLRTSPEYGERIKKLLFGE